MTPHAEIAVGKFREGFNCAQSIFHTYAVELGIAPDIALKIANGFGGGIGRKQEVCGAVTGAIMALGLLHGRGEHDDPERTNRLYVEVRTLIDAFTERHGTICCRDLLSGCSLLSPEGRSRFQAERLIERCHGYVRSACDILDQLWSQPPE